MPSAKLRSLVQSELRQGKVKIDYSHLEKNPTYLAELKSGLAKKFHKFTPIETLNQKL